MRSPFDREPIGEVPRSTPADVAAAAVRARHAQSEWAQKTLRRARAGSSSRFHDRLLERQDEVLDLIQLESGKARLNAFEEVADAAIVARFYAVHAGEYLAPQDAQGRGAGAHRERASTGTRRASSASSPPGTTRSRWASPTRSRRSSPATPWSRSRTRRRRSPLLWALDLLVDCGLPEDLYQVVCGDGPTLGPAIFDASDYVQFTGSTATGRHVAREAGSRLTGCSLELGGKNPMLVLADADLDARGGRRGAQLLRLGRAALRLDRADLRARVGARPLPRRLRRRDEEDPARRRPRLDLRGRLAHLREAARHRRRARGGRGGAMARALECGGKPRPDVGPLVYEPTVLSGVPPEAKLFSEETFGPVVAVYPVASNHEAIEQRQRLALRPQRLRSGRGTPSSHGGWRRGSPAAR